MARRGSSHATGLTGSGWTCRSRSGAGSSLAGHWPLRQLATRRRSPVGVPRWGPEDRRPLRRRSTSRSSSPSCLRGLGPGSARARCPGHTTYHRWRVLQWDLAPAPLRRVRCRHPVRRRSALLVTLELDRHRHPPFVATDIRGSGARMPPPGETPATVVLAVCAAMLLLSTIVLLYPLCERGRDGGLHRNGPEAGP
jgi:hypothetical protein